jgi:spermidine synthase
MTSLAPASSQTPLSPLAAEPPASPESPDTNGAALRLACYSALILFFELAFIRYTSAHVRVFSFYQNFVLIATFLGMGVGLLRADATRWLKWIGVPMLVGLVGLVAFFSRASIAPPPAPDDFVWAIFPKRPHDIPMLVVVVALFATCTMFFVPLGALMGREFKQLPPLRAYTFDIVGSLLGILAFGILSATRQPPVIWFALAVGVWVVASLGDRRYAMALGLAGAAALLIVEKTGESPLQYWSPYYRVGLWRADNFIRVDVNGSLHQLILHLDSASASRDEFTSIVRHGYLRPYQNVVRVDTALVVGAGTGNDLSLLLQQGAKYIDAVEIDPVIADLGSAAHPNHPYDDPRVHLHINDARAFLRTAQQHYDVIVFGTLDSQTLLGGMSSVRLDNYVYTVESFQSARARLKPDGSLIVYHMSGWPYIAAKIHQMLRDAFGEEPGVYTTYAQLFNFTWVAGHGARSVAAPPIGKARLLAEPYERPHDDWPYLYLKGRRIPGHYLTALAGVLLVSLVFVGAGAGRVLARGFDAPMFLMGTAFLLVETKSVTEMSLLFGSTWMVNLLVFSSILIMVLAANLVVLRWRPVRTHWFFAGLLASLALAYALPASQLLTLGQIGQWIAGGLMVALPVLFASLIFSTLLKRRGDATRALAYNLLGAIVGGMIEYSSMVFGIKALYLFAGAVYIGALLMSLREERALSA